MKFLVPSLKHFLHTIVMISWITIGISITLNHRGEENPFTNYGIILGLILILIRLVSLLAFPQTFLNFISLLIYETFQEKVNLKISPESAPVFIVRVVTRGLYPNLVEKTVAKNLETLLSVGCVNFEIEVVTDKILDLNIYKTSQQVTEIVVPSNYKSKSGALYKARALQYCWEDDVSMIQDDDWIVHLDEETQLSPDSIKGIINFIHNNYHQIGQGMITYAHEQPKFDAWSKYIQNRICTVADSFRVTEDLGKIRGQFNLFHKAVFGMKGSYVVTKAKVEKAVSFDNGLAGSIAEDAYFAIKAMDKGYTFGFIEGEMWEKSPFSFEDFTKQRKRWMQGIYLVATDSKLTFKNRFFIGMSIYAWITVPLATSNVVLTKYFPLQLPWILDVMIGFMGAMPLYLYILGYVLQHPLRRYSYLKLILVIPEIILASITSLILENVAVILMWFGNWYEFYIVQKESEDLKQNNNADDSKPLIEEV